jgi:hypothetical protein
MMLCMKSVTPNCTGTAEKRLLNILATLETRADGGPSCRPLNAATATPAASDTDPRGLVAAATLALMLRLRPRLAPRDNLRDVDVLDLGSLASSRTRLRSTLTRNALSAKLAAVPELGMFWRGTPDDIAADGSWCRSDRSNVFLGRSFKSNTLFESLRFATFATRDVASNGN